jgi:hypothetical protein
MTTSTRLNQNEEGERLRLCRERNKMHAQTTRDRKKSQIGSLENRIGNLVDEVRFGFICSVGTIINCFDH